MLTLRARALPLVLVLALMAAPWGAAAAQLYRTYGVRFQTNDAGEILLRGNTLTTCLTAAPGCTAAQGHTGAVTVGTGTLDNNAYNASYVDIDGDPSTFNSSRSTLTIPFGSSVLWAGLYWSGRSGTTSRNTMRFRTPTTAGYTSLTADQLDVNGNDYQAFKNVTALVQAGGSGAYTGANVVTTINASNNYAAWSLVVVLRNPARPLRNLTVFDGWANISGSSTINVTVSGFLTPALGTPNTIIGVVTYEGDRGIVGDQLQVNGVVQSNTINASTNFFNSTIADTTTYLTSGQTPALTNQQGFDAKTFRTTNVPAGATSARLTFTSTGDQYYPGVVTFQTDLFNPVINGNVVKSVRDKNGNVLSLVAPGDTLRYDMLVSNTGQDGSVNTVLIDTIPSGVTYVPGSLEIVSGSNTGPKSDLAGDDQAEFIAVSNRVLFRIGTGAGATTGGNLAPSASTRVRFRVRINDVTPAGFQINNQAYVTATSQTLGSAINAASRDSASTGGTPPTPTPVAGPNLTISKSHVGDFIRSGNGSWTVTVQNVGNLASSAVLPVVVLDTIPAPLVPTAASGTGWSCSISGQVVSCSRTGAIAAAGAAPPITIAVTVPVNTPASITNIARVSGGGDNTPGNNAASDFTVTLGAPDFSLTKTALTTPFVIGAPASWRLRVTNVGSAANGTDITVTDTLATGLTFTSGTGTNVSCAAVGQVVTCTRPGASPVAVGDSVDITLTVAVAANAAPGTVNRARVANSDDPNAANNAATAGAVSVISDPDLALTKSATGVFTVGQNATYQLKVKHVALSPTVGTITLTDSLRPGLTFVAASGGSFSCSAAASLVTCTRTTPLNAGDSALVNLTVAVGLAALPSASNKAWVTTTGDVNVANDTATVTGTPVTGVPDLSVSKSAGGVFAIGQSSVFNITVANLGSNATTDSIIVTDSLASSLTFVSATGPGFTCTFAAPLVRCARGTPIVAGASVAITLTVTPTVAALPTVTNLVRVSTSGDADPANNTFTLPSTTVVSVPDLRITKSFSGAMTIGQPASWTIRVVNVSPGPTTGTITVVDSISAGLTGVSATGTGFTCGFASPLVSCSRSAALAPGDSVLITVTATPSAATGTAVTNRASVTTPGDLNTFNDTSVTTPRAVQRPNLAIAKSHVGSFTALDTLGTQTNQWTITLTNSGAAATTGTITVVDSLPAQVQYVSTPSSGWSCGVTGALVSGRVVTCTNPGPLPAGGTATLTLVVSVLPTAASSVTNIARVSTADDLDTANDRATDVTTVVAAPDLQLFKSNNRLSALPQPLPFQVGAASQSYALTLTNIGAGPTTGVITLTDTMPQGMLFTSGTGTSVTCAAIDSLVGASPRRQIVQCTRSVPLAANTSVVVTLNVTVDASAIPIVTNTARVSTPGDPNAANDAATDAPTPVVNPVDLTITKAAITSFTIGATSTYQVVVTNLGTGTATTATTVVDTLSPGLTFVSSGSGGGGFSCSVTATLSGPTREVVTCTRGSGGPSGTLGVQSATSYTFNINVNPAAAALPTIANRVEVTNSSDNNVSNNTFATGAIPVSSLIDLKLTKSPNGPVIAGSTADFTLSVVNLGTGSTTGAMTITDTLPLGLGLTSVTNTGGSFNACTLPDSVVEASPRRKIVECVRPAGSPLTAGEQATLTLTVSVAASAFPTVQNRATIATAGDVNTVNDTSSTSVLAVSSVPDFSLVKVGTSPLSVGAPANFTLTISNVSPLAPGGNTGDIVVTDTLPIGITFDAAATAANTSTIASLFTCTVATIAGPRDVVTCTRPQPPGVTAILKDQDATVVLVTAVTPAAIGTITNRAWVASTGDLNIGNNSGTTSLLAVVVPDLTVAKTVTPATLLRAQTGTYDITVTNAGTGPTTGTITVTDNLPIGLEFVSSAPVAWSCAATGTFAAGQTVTCTNPAVLAAAATSTVTLTVRVDTSAAATVSNSVSVATPNEQVTGNNTFTLASTPVANAPDLALASAVVGQWIRNQQGQLLLTPTNNGSSATSGTTTITTTLPAGVSFVSTTTPGWSCAAVLQVVTCSTTTVIPVGGALPVTLTVAVSDAAAASVTVPSTVATTGDPNAANNSASSTIATTAAPDLRTTKALASSLIAGQTATYTITVNNVGSAVTTGPITVTDVLDANLTYVIGTGGLFGCGISAQTMTCTRSTALAAGDSAQITLSVTVAPLATGSILNIATASTTGDPNPANDGGTTGAIPVGAAPDLTLTSTISGAAIAGQPITIAFTPTNSGSAPTSGTTTLTTTLPPGATFTGSTGAGWSCTQVGTLVTCTTTTVIPVGGTQPLSLVVTLPTTQSSPVSFPTTIATTGDPNPANDATSPSATVTTAPDLALTVAAVGAVTAGQPATFRFNATNLGSAATTDTITITSTLPAGVTFTGSTTPGWTCSAVLQVVTCKRAGPVLAIGDSVQVEIATTVASTVTGSIAIPGTVTTATDPNAANNSASATVPVGSAPDLALTGSVVGPLTAGQAGTVRFVPRNVGSAPTSGSTSVAITIPTGATWNGTNPAGYSCTFASPTLTCTTTTPIAAGDSLPLTIGVTVANAAPASLAFPATVTNAGDPNATNNSAAPSAVVGSAPDLALSVAPVGPVVAAQPASFALTARNVGSASTTDTITVTTTLPTGITFTGTATPGWVCSAVAQVVTCRRAGPALAAGDSAQVVIATTVAPSLSGTVSVPSTVATAGDPSATNNGASTTVTVTQAPDLRLTGGVVGPLVAGQGGTLRFVPTNIGSAGTTGPTSIAVTLPTGVAWNGVNPVGWTCSVTGTVLTCVSPTTIAVGDSLPVSVGITVPLGAPATLSFPATTSSTGDPALGNNSTTPSAPVNVAADLTVSIAAVGPFVAGQAGVLRVVPRNVGGAATGGVNTVTINLPTGITFTNATVPAGWSCSAVAQIVTCTSSTPIAVNDSSVLTLGVAVGSAAVPSVTPTVTVGNAGDTNASNDAASTVIPVTTAPDLTLTTSIGGPLIVGRPGTVTLGTTNRGSAPTTGPQTITTTLPPGTTFTGSTGTGWTCTAVGQVVTCTNPAPLPIGDSTTVVITFGVGPAAAPGITIGGTTTTSGDGDPTNNTSTTTVPVILAPDLTITKAAVGAFTVGSPATYALTVSNIGSGATTGPITVTDSLPASLTFVSATGAGYGCVQTNGVITCTSTAALAAGANAVITVVTTPTEAALPTVVNVARAATAGDPDTSNDRAQVTTPVTGVINLAIIKSGADTLTVGGTATWSLGVSNVGSLVIPAPFTVVDTLPVGITFAAASGSGFACSASGQVVSCARGTPLTPGTSVPISVSGTVSPAAYPAVTNRAWASVLNDVDSTNNVSTKPSIVTGVVDLAVRKVASQASLTAGLSGSFVLTVANRGTIPTQGPVTLIDSLPVGLAYVSAVAPSWSCTGAGQLMTCTRATPLLNGDSSLVTVTTSVAATATGILTNVAVASTALETNVTNNRATAAVTVTGDFRLFVAKESRSPAVTVGGTNDYTIVVRNIGASPVPDVVINDQLPRGFLYVAGSTTVDGTAAGDPSGSPAPLLQFALGTLNVGAERRITYRTRITAQVQEGRSVNTAAAISRTAGLNIQANAAAAPVQVRRSVFSDRGVIVGKVFTRCDCGNATGQQASELGVPGVRVVMEDGTASITDVEGKYNFWDVPSGLHVVRVDPLTVPEGARFEVLSNRNAGDGGSRFVDLKGGELRTADFAFTSDADVYDAVRARRRLGEGTGGVTGAILLGTPSAAGGVASAGGVVGGGAVGTGMTGLTTGTSGELQPMQTIPGIAPGTAPDGSATRSLLFAPTPRELFVTGLLQARVDVTTFRRGDSQFAASDAFERQLNAASFGNDTSMWRGGVRSALFAKGTVLTDKLLTLGWDSERNPDRTAFRDIDPDLMFPTYGDASQRGFETQARQRFYARLDDGRNFLRLGDFQTQRVGDIRQLGAWDRTLTGLQAHSEGKDGVINVYGARTAVRQVVDELPGRGLSGPYLLTRLPLINTERVELITRDRNQPSLIVAQQMLSRFADYVIEAGTNRVVFRNPVPSLDERFNPVAVRVSYEVEQAGEQFTTAGADAQVHLTDRLQVGAVVALDQNPLDSLRLFGVNAGLQLTKGTMAVVEMAQASGLAGRSGSAERFEVRHASTGLEWRLYGIRSDSAFANRSTAIGAGRQELGARFSTTLGEGRRLFAEGIRTEDLITGGARRGVTAGIEQKLRSWLRGEAGMRWADETVGKAATSSTVGLLTPPSFTALRGRLTAQPNSQSSLFAEFERAVQGDVSRLSLGGEQQLPMRTRLYGRYERIDGFGGPYALTKGQSQDNLVIGLSGDWIRSSQLFSEYRARDAFAGRDVEASMGLRNRWMLAKGLLANASFERVAPLVQGTTSKGTQTAVTGALDWTARDVTKMTGRIEWRSGNGTGDNWLASAGVAQKLSRDWTFLARTLYDETPALSVDRWRSHAGFAWRETDGNTWNALFRYEHLRDQQGAATLAVTAARNERHLVHALVNVSPAPRWTLSGRVAGVWETNTSNGLSTDTRSQLLYGRAMYDLTPSWDVGLITSVVLSEGLAQRQTNVGAEVGRLIARNLRVAAGYNTHGYSDRIANAFGYTTRGFYLDVGFKFDETLFTRRPAAPVSGASK